MNNKRTKIWAHRGASDAAPENTMEAFVLAADMNADGIELDVHLSKDGKVVVIHDERVDRTTDGMGYIKDYDYEELLYLNAHNKMSEFKNLKIPLLRDVLLFCKQNDIFVNIEFKTSVFRYEGIEEKVATLLQTMGMTEQVILSSFNHYSLLKVKQFDAQLKTGAILHTPILNVYNYLKQHNIDAFHPSMNLYNTYLQEHDDVIRQEDIPTHIWGVHKEEDVITCSKNNIEAIITNFPDRDRQILERNLLDYV